uniref:Uncharacterized protein n=1 Tax=Cannabis sativa TaxID=3483 RepID=A0A803R086_CANSA
MPHRNSESQDNHQTYTQIIQIKKTINLFLITFELEFCSKEAETLVPKLLLLLNRVFGTPFN